MRQELNHIKNVVSGERVYSLVKEITTYHRIQASTGYRAAAQHVAKRLEGEGLKVRIRTYPADGKTWFFTSKMFKEWDCRDATLNLVSPEKRLADFKTNNMSLIQRSYPCDYRDKPLDIVLLDKGTDAAAYGDIDLQGKLIFVREHFQPFLDWAVKEKGAAGIITDFIREMKDVRSRSDLYDIYNYTSFWWKHTENEPQTFGFVLTPRAGDELAKLCQQMKEAHVKDPSKDEYPQATCYVDSSLYDGTIEVVEALLPGETEEEVLMVAHLCHPRASANDNASGVAASMEAIKVLKDLIVTGKLKALKRSIRVIFVPEFTGTYAYLHDLGDKMKRIKGGINLDMVGGRQTHGYGPIRICDLPHAAPSFVVDLAALVLDEVSKNLPSSTPGNYITMFNAAISDFEAGSDHLVLCDPTIQIPAVMLGQWPDLNYHTSADIVEVVDPFILHKSVSIAAGFIYTLANLAEDDVQLLLIKSRERLVQALTKYIRNALEEQLEPRRLYEQFRHTTDFFNACNETCLKFFVGEAAGRVQNQVQESNELISNLSRLLWARYCNDFAPDYDFAPEEAPEEYRYVPYRKYSAPLFHLEDYALGDSKKMADFKDHVDNHRSKLSSGHSFDAIVQFYIDGKRSVHEIAREAALETGDGSVEYVDHFIKLLESYDLVGIKE